MYVMYNHTVHPHGYTKDTRLRRKEIKGKEMEYFEKYKDRLKWAWIQSHHQVTLGPLVSQRIQSHHQRFTKTPQGHHTTWPK